MSKLYLEYINGLEVYYSEGKWFVEDEYGWEPHDTYEDAKEAAEHWYD